MHRNFESNKMFKLNNINVARKVSGFYENNLGTI